MIDVSSAKYRTNQKLRSWANAVFQNRGVCGQAFPSFPSPSPVFPLFFALVPTFLDELARKRLLRRLFPRPLFITAWKEGLKSFFNAYVEGVYVIHNH